MATISLQPAISANGVPSVGDAQYERTLVNINATTTELRVGRESDKAGVNRAFIAHYDTSSIPLLVEAVTAKLEMRAAGNTTGALDITIEVMTGTSSNKFNRVSYDTHNDSQFSYLPAKGGSPWVTTLDAYPIGVGGTGVDGYVLIDDLNSYGVGSIAQVWKPNATTSLTKHWWRGLRSGSLSGVTVRTDVYSVTGSAGAYTKNALLNTGTTHNAVDVIPTSAAGFTMDVGGGSLLVLDSGTYISELVFSGFPATPVAGDTVSIALRLSESNAATYNAYVEARTGYVLQGFGGFTQHHEGNLITALGNETPDTVAFPDFADDELYIFGHTDYEDDGPNFEPLTNLSTKISEQLNARTGSEKWLAIRLDSETTTSARERTIHSSGAATVTVGSLKGMVLTIEYFIPALPPSGGHRIAGRLRRPDQVERHRIHTGRPHRPVKNPTKGARPYATGSPVHGIGNENGNFAIVVREHGLAGGRTYKDVDSVAYGRLLLDDKRTERHAESYRTILGPSDPDHSHSVPRVDKFMAIQDAAAERYPPGQHVWTKDRDAGGIDNKPHRPISKDVEARMDEPEKISGIAATRNRGWYKRIGEDDSE